MTGAEDQANPSITVTVQVNGRPVVFHKHHATGAEIKATAIAQGVMIQPDFLLFEVKSSGELKQIGDSEVVTLHAHEQFRAVAPDDNSEGLNCHQRSKRQWKISAAHSLPIGLTLNQRTKEGRML